MRLAYALALLLLAVPAAAQTPDSAGVAPPALIVVDEPTAAETVVTFEEAVDLALQRDVRLRRAAVAEQTAGLAVRSAELDVLPLPNVTAQLRPTQRYGLAFDQTTGQLSSATSEALDAGLSASINLFNGYRDQRTLEQARLSRRAQAYAYQRTRDDIIFDTAQRFLQVLLDRELVEIQREALVAQQAQLDQITALVEAGARPRADVITQQAQIASAELALLQATSAAELSAMRLAVLLRLPPTTDVAFTAPDVSGVDVRTLAAQPLPFSYDDLLARALDRRSDLRAQRFRIRASEQGARIAASGRLPRVDLTVSAGTGFSSLQRRTALDGNGLPTVIDPGTPVVTANGDPVLLGGVPLTFGSTTETELTPVFSQFADNRAGSVGLSVTFPLFDRYTTQRGIEQARVQTRDARLALETLEQQVELDLQQTLIEYRTAAERLRLTDVQVEAAEEALRVARDRYTFGVGTLLEIDQARAQLVRARAERARAVFQFLFQRKLVDYAAGSLDPDAPLFE